MKDGSSKAMKTTIKTLCGMLAMLAFTACSSNNDEAVNTPQFWHVTLTASMGDADTRALSEGEGNIITASFAAGDKVKVLKSDGSEVGTLTAKTAGASTTLEGNISGTFSVNEELTCRYRSATANYDNQVGTLEGIGIATTCKDYAEGTLTVSATDPLTFTSTNVTLSPKQSITKFSFTDGANPANAISVKNFRIIATGLVQSITTNGAETVGTVTGTLATASSDVYIALRNNVAGKQTYTFIVKDDAGNWHVGTKNAKLTNGKNYTATVALNSTLTSGSDEGTIGVVGGLPAIVVDLGGTIGKKAVALMNAGATWPEDYGTYYSFENRASGLSNGWYVPTQAELYVKVNDEVTGGLAKISNSWTTQNGVNGRLFTIIEGKTLFLPAAGLDDGDNDPHDFLFVSTDGYYWSSTNYYDDEAYSLNFDSGVCQIIGWYKVDRLTVRPFHDLP